MMTRIILPWNGLVNVHVETDPRSWWPLWCLHGWSGETGVTGYCCWQRWHCCTDCSISLSISGHHTYIQASAFIFIILGCPSCSSCSIVDCPSVGNTTLEPHDTAVEKFTTGFVLILKRGHVPTCIHTAKVKSWRWFLIMPCTLSDIILTVEQNHYVM